MGFSYHLVYNPLWLIGQAGILSQWETVDQLEWSYSEHINLVGLIYRMGLGYKILRNVDLCLTWTMWQEFRSFRRHPLRWLRRRYLRWLALFFWCYQWVVCRGEQRQQAQTRIIWIVAGFDRAAWLVAMEDFIKPEYWVM
jgi:hypothetical protein